jgi:hypothetical protein
VAETQIALSLCHLKPKPLVEVAKYEEALTAVAKWSTPIFPILSL